MELIHEWNFGFTGLSRDYPLNSKSAKYQKSTEKSDTNLDVGLCTLKVVMLLLNYHRKRFRE